MLANAHLHPAGLFRTFVILLATLLAINSLCIAGMDKDRHNALYFPPHKITQRTIEEVIHYARTTPVNAVVLHVKTPKGQLLWASQNPLANQLGVSARSSSHLAAQVIRLKDNHIHTIAKLDAFADHQLASTCPDLSVMDNTTDRPWSDANGLHWSNPADSRVWRYNIALARELVQLGFDEIQFDYVRFPSDGDLSRIQYPNTPPGFSKSDSIASFLEMAALELKPLGVSLSADIFGLTAWKTDDFGVGQVLEKMAPHLDVICPMFYPSHFPAGFLGKPSPGDFPEMIMESSMRSIMRRTRKPVRPWLQGFWYNEMEISAQIDGIEKAKGGSWSIWSPTGRYGLAYEALAQRAGVEPTKPKFYASTSELADQDDRMTQGHSTVVNYTSYKLGYSIISLEAPKKGERSRYASPAAVLATIDEGIVDQILKARSIAFNPDAEPYGKRMLLGDLLCSDLGKDARRMRPEPIYIDWSRDCMFTTRDIPDSRLVRYAAAAQKEGQDAVDRLESKTINVASVSDSIFGVAMKTVNDSLLTVFSR